MSENELSDFVYDKNCSMYNYKKEALKQMKSILGVKSTTK